MSDENQEYTTDLSDVKSSSSDIDKQREKRTSTSGMNYGILIAFVGLFLVFVIIMFMLTAPQERKEQIIKSAEELANSSSEKQIDIKNLGLPKIEVLSASVEKKNDIYANSIKLRVRAYKGHGSVDLSKAIIKIDYKNVSYTYNYSGSDESIPMKAFGIKIITDPTESFSYEKPYVHERGLAEVLINVYDENSEPLITPRTVVILTLFSSRSSKPESFQIEMPESFSNINTELVLGQGITKIQYTDSDKQR
ncbi:MAG: hypothetical protein N3E37_01090 [Candidatus Micrarchaeota archaeon]|nr:hypothetical protein [Candidatus Micrarchaeota archaeon]